MGKINGSALWIKITSVLIALVLGGGSWWLNRVDDRAVIQAATINEHAVRIATTDAKLTGVREDVARVEKAVGKNADKLDRLLLRKD